MTIDEQVPLAPLTTFRLGGAARLFVRVTTVEELREALAAARQRGVAVHLLGGGANTLVRDEGFAGMVIAIALAGKALEGTLLTAAAGEPWDGLVAHAVSHNLWGLENLSGIPGTVGGAVVQNVGAYGAALSDTLTSVEVLDTHTGEVRTLSARECALGYRDSLFKRQPGRFVVLSATFGLSAMPAPNCAYKDVAERFAGVGEPALRDIREAILAIRAAKFPDLAAEGTAGSFFKNPIFSPAQAEALARRYPGMPTFAMPEVAGIKVPLAWLLDHALNLKGARVGGARLFEKQVLAIAASRDAHAGDVIALAQMVQARVHDALGITVEFEVCVL